MPSWALAHVVLGIGALVASRRESGNHRHWIRIGVGMLDVNDVQKTTQSAGQGTGQDAGQKQPRARGAAHVRVKPFNGHTVLADLHQAGSLKVVFPKTEGAPLQAVTVNTAGGITGGDRFEAAFEATAQTTLTVTTQAAERAYAAKNETGKLSTQLRVHAGARLNWLPQETILFEASHFTRRMDVNLEGDGQLLFVEPLVFGRTARGETLRDVAFRDTVHIKRDGAPLFEDAMHVSGDVTAHMKRTAHGAAAFASVVYVAPNAEAHLQTVRALLPQHGGASLLQSDVLHIRLLAQDSFVLRQSLIPILGALNTAQLPRVWMI